jgi:tRNA nucleotidyltransferase/poly(A) polymerase
MIGIKFYFCKPKSLNISLLSTSSNHGLKKYYFKTPLIKKIVTEELVYLFELFSKKHFELRIAGGAVRDLLLQKIPNDVDLASNALPEEMLEIFSKEKIRVLNLNGIKHGTIPIRINNRVIHFDKKKHFKNIIELTLLLISF